MFDIYVPNGYIEEQLDKGNTVEYLHSLNEYDYYAIYQKEFPQEYIVYTDAQYKNIFGVIY